MRKIKKIIMSLVLIGVMVIGMCGTVSAKTTTGVWNSPKTTAGVGGQDMTMTISHH